MRNAQICSENTMKFVFVAVNYNGSSHTENYLQSLQEISVPEGDVLQSFIVDNNSSESDLANVRDSVLRRDFAQLIAQDRNPGYFGGLNAGLDICSKNEETIFIVGNNDLKFAADFLVQFKKIPREQDVLVIAPDVLTLDGRRQNPHVVTKVSALELVKARIYFSNYYVGQVTRCLNGTLRYLVNKLRRRGARRGPAYEPVRMKIKRGIGACYILTPRFFDHHQRLDDRVFLWGEEALLSHQVEAVGGSTLYEPSLKVTHCESASVRFIQKRERYEIVKASYKIYRPYL